MKVTTAIKTIYDLLAQYDSYKIKGEYIALEPDIKYYNVNVWVNGALFTIVHEWDFDDTDKLIELAYYTICACDIVIKMKAAGK